jgi:HD-GYP domain-containing protein (c-di-GMP phosphodiesterase class II)
MKTAVKKVRVDSTDLSIGMYVCDLDRPWPDSPFLIQGFFIKDDNDIDTVRRMCEYVYVDKIVPRELLTIDVPTASSALLSVTPVIRSLDSSSNAIVDRAGDAKISNSAAKSKQGIEHFFPDRKLTKYTHTVSWRDEAAKAKAAILGLYDFIATFMRASAQSDRLNIENIRQAVEPMVDSVIRNPDACLWSTVMKPETSSSYDAALRSAVFSCVLGRQLGLPRRDLCSLAIGGMLFDIGKLRLGDNILHADRRLTDKEMTIMQRHVEVGLSILQDGGLSDPDIIDFIANHHERHDGSGYPRGLAGDLIPVFGRIAGVVDCYNAITSSRRYASTRSPAEAINQLYKLKGVHFNKDLIDEFIQAIGVYPVGAMVELSTGEVAIVAAQSSSRRLRPIVVLLLDSEKNPCREGHYINLEEITHSEDGSKLDIVKNLEPNAFGIDRGAIKLS